MMRMKIMAANIFWACQALCSFLYISLHTHNKQPLDDKIIQRLKPLLADFSLSRTYVYTFGKVASIQAPAHLRNVEPLFRRRSPYQTRNPGGTRQGETR